MPSTSGAQHRAMAAAATGHSNLGIPKTVGQEFLQADKGHSFKDAADQLDAILDRIDARKLDAIISRCDADFNEADHPRDADGKFTTAGGAAAHGIAGYKKALNGKKPTGSGLMQHMIMTGKYSEADIAKAWNQLTGGTTPGAVKGQINLLKKAGKTPPPLPKESLAPWDQASSTEKKPAVSGTSVASEKPYPEPIKGNYKSERIHEILTGTADKDTLAFYNTDEKKLNLLNSYIVHAESKEVRKHLEEVKAIFKKKIKSASAEPASTEPSANKEPPPIDPAVANIINNYNEEELAKLLNSNVSPGIKVYAAKKLGELNSVTAPVPPPTPENTKPISEIAKGTPTTIEGFKVGVQTISPPAAKDKLKTVLDNFDKLTPENKVKVKAKIQELLVAGTPPPDTEKLKNLTLIDGFGQSVIAVNEAIDEIKDHWGVDKTAAAAPVASTPAQTAPITPAATPVTNKVSAKPSPRLTRMLDAYAKAKKFQSSKDSGSKEVCPSLDHSFWNKINPSQRAAAKSYTGSGYMDMNTALRAGKTDMHTAQQVNHIEDLFEHDDAELKEDVILRRGEKVPESVITQWEEALKSGLPCRYQKSGFISTSIASEAAFGGNVAFEIVARKGTRALGVDTISVHNENEVLLRHGQNFEIFEIEKINGKTVVRMATIN